MAEKLQKLSLKNFWHKIFMHFISYANLALMLIPLALVAMFYWRWGGDAGEIGISTARMVAQLILVGYILTSLFATKSSVFLMLMVLVMIVVSGWIALHNLKVKNKIIYMKITFAIAIGGTINLVWVLLFILELPTLIEPRVVIPLAGMIYANAMNMVSLAAERLESEIEKHTYHIARRIALKAAMIPQINTFLAVGLVALPGMMTGQILSGIDPMIAVRYQIVVMAMVLSSGAMSSMLYLAWYKNPNLSQA